MQDGATATGFIDKRAAAHYSGLSPRSLDAAKARGDLPFIRFSARKVLFRREDLDRWLNGMRVDATRGGRK
jgi:hypothetical protein